MKHRLWTILGFLSICLVGQTSAGCSNEMSPWLRKVLGEQTQVCYGYGEEGEFFNLQFHGIDNERRRELGKEIGKGTLSGDVRCWALGEKQRTMFKYTGAPLTKRAVPGGLQYDEEWEYPRVVLLFQRGRLVDVRPKGTEQPEFVWRETYIPK